MKDKQTLSRREFLHQSLLGAGAMTFASHLRARTAPRSGDRMNVLFIAIEDLNDWIGCLGGHPQAKTPNIDHVADLGVLFTHAYCAAPACGPSRAALLTGLRPSTSGNYKNRDSFARNRVLSRAVTLPEYFRRNGYYTLGTGKIFHGTHFRELRAAGWDEYWPSKNQAHPPSLKPTYAPLPLNGIPQAAHFDWGPLDEGVELEDTSDGKKALWVAKTLRERKFDQPFLLAIGFMRPHLPWYAPRKYFDLHPLDSIQLPKVKEDDLDDVPPLGRKIANPSGDHRRVLEHKQWSKAVQAYLACGSFMDECVGLVVEALLKSPYRDNTIIVLWSDHGWHLGEKLHWRKFTLWEEATRVPMIWVVPGLTKPGARCDAPVNLMDIYSTLITGCGLPPQEQLEGYDLTPLLQNPRAPWNKPTLTTHGRGNHAVRSRRWRYIRYADGSEELYDHENDPLEWTNLANDPKYAKAKTQLARWLPKEDAPEGPYSRSQPKR
ncbi:MAG TPA: iduronate-2-sulfatase [Armatimonadetes bacterium]|nr:iduronate-2-sulfatase [Armatimonadota bacterium]